MSTTNTVRAGARTVAESERQMHRLVSWAQIGIVSCLLFFVVAFIVTSCSSRHDVPSLNVIITGSTNITQKVVAEVVHEVMLSNEYQQKLETIVSDREQIVKQEHDYFKAELGTWLSIFGLLSILATIMFSVLAFACQHLSLKGEKDEIYASLSKLSIEQKKEKKQLKESRNRVKEAKTQVAEIGKQMTEIKTKLEEAERLNATITRNANQSMAASEALAPDDSSDFGNVPYVELADIERECKKFINMWWWENDGDFEQEINKKVAKGISVLRMFNDLLSKKINNNEDITVVLKKLNLVNVYLGQKERINPFYARFIEALRRDKPLQVKIDDVQGALKQGGTGQLQMFLGYYTNLQKHQG